VVLHVRHVGAISAPGRSRKRQGRGIHRERAYRPRAAYAPSVETSVYVAPSHAGRGLGSSLYEALLSELEREDVHRAYAGIGMPNPASVRLHERFGFRRAGYYTEQGRKFGRYWDVAWYERSFPEVASATSG